jgi:hypothetical protein
MDGRDLSYLEGCAIHLLDLPHEDEGLLVAALRQQRAKEEEDIRARIARSRVEEWKRENAEEEDDGEREM